MASLSVKKIFFFSYFSLYTGDNLKTLQICEHKATESISAPSSLGQRSLLARMSLGRGKPQLHIGALCHSNQESVFRTPGDGPSHHGITKSHNLFFMQNICWSGDFNHSLLQCMWTLLASLEELRGGGHLLSGFPGIPTWPPESSSH